MAISLYIDEVENTEYISVNYDHQLGSRKTATIKLKGLDGVSSFRPEIGDPIRVVDQDGSQLFAGSIDSFEQEQNFEGSQEVFTMIRAVGREKICDRFVVARVYESSTLKVIVEDIVATIMPDEGIDTSEVETGPTFTKVVFPYYDVTRCFNELAEIANMSWWIDDSAVTKKLYFKESTSIAAPWSISDTDFNVLKLKIGRNRSKYRNRQYLIGGAEVTSARTDTFMGDGARTAFGLNYPCAEAPTSIKVNSVEKTIGVRAKETGYDWYWQKGSNEITQDDGDTPLSGISTLEVTYVGQYPFAAVVQDDIEILARQAAEGGSGIYESVEQDRTVENSTQGSEKVIALLAKYGNIQDIATFSTRTPGLRAGQLIPIQNATFDIDEDFLIQGVTGHVADGQFIFNVTAVCGTGLDTWIAFFQKLADSRRDYTLREDEVLLLLRSLTETVSFADTLTAASAAPESRIGFATIGFSEISA